MKLCQPFLPLFLLMRSTFAFKPVPFFLTKVVPRPYLSFRRSFSQLSNEKGHDVGTSLTSKTEGMSYNQLLEYYKSHPNRNQLLQDTLKFPCKYPMKIIGNNEPNSKFVEDMIEKASLILKLDQSLPYSLKHSSSAALVSISIQPSFDSADQIYSMYDELQKDVRVKMIL
jgi:putative lipoic acid-binding regulatory protein